MKLSDGAAALLLCVLCLQTTACGDSAEQKGAELVAERPAAPGFDDVYGFVDGCYSLEAGAPDADRWGYLVPTDDGTGFAFSTTQPADASRFFLKASDLGTYLFYDVDGHYLVADDHLAGEDEDAADAEAAAYARKAELRSDILELDDDYLPGAQWAFEPAAADAERLQLRHLATGDYLGIDGLVATADDAATVALHPAAGCTPHPELSLDAEGTVEPRQFDDGSVWGFVETHSHIMSNFGFGGGGIFHGAPYHPLGVEHALPSCEQFHGPEGRQDLFGYGFDNAESGQDQLLETMVTGRTPEFNHHTDGYPTFTDWPSAHFSSTHQTQYYKWIERAYLGGLRLMVQHATTNQVICELIVGSDAQDVRYSCNDMVAVDRILEETRKFERYIDAQAGGPGQGWFRIVDSPAEARQVIDEGKLAVVLGIETSNLFDCFLVPPEGFERCDEQDVIAKLDEYWDKGVRVIFPVHKYDNAFSAGDGHRGIIELGNFAQTGHYSNFTTDCPDVPAVFDKGDVVFGDLNQPRDDYFGAPPNDMSGFALDPIDTLIDYTNELYGDSLQGDYCQNYGLTPLGEFLISELMARGMIIEVDHLPRRSYERAFEILEANDYPAAGTHGSNNRGELYALGGISKFNFRNCADPDQPGTRVEPLADDVALIEQHGGYPAEGFGFDLNGFAGAPGPRFGPNTVCDQPQQNPVTYPFTSYGGDITFTQPQVGERTIDFNTEGLAHIGLIPELIEDVRRDGVTDAELEPLFRSAEGYLRMWEKAERRGQAISGQ